MAGQNKIKAKSAREAAFSILNRVDDAGAYADILLQEALERLDLRERPLATELVYGVLRFRLRLDWIIGNFSKLKTAKLETRVLNAMRLGVYQLCFLDGIPASAAVDESVKLVKKDGAKTAGFVNAVLRAVTAGKEKISYPDAKKDAAQFISIFHSHPLWLVRRWMERWGAGGATELCETNLAPPPRSLRANTLKINRDALLEELLKEGVEVKKSRFSPDGGELPPSIEAARRVKLSSDDKRFYVQDEASQLIAYLVAPKPNEVILDACAAPGGKATHMAAMMKNQGVIWALDKSAVRLKGVEQTARRLCADIIKTKQADAEKPLTFAEGSFDAILCDSPCSGLGVVRRTPDIKWRIKEGDLKELSGRQKRLLNNLSRYLKKGGRLVYSVCTFEPEETEEIIKGFLSANTGFVMENAALYLPESCKGLVDPKGFLMTLPHKHGCDGFFAARLYRAS